MWNRLLCSVVRHPVVLHIKIPSGIHLLGSSGGGICLEFCFATSTSLTSHPIGAYKYVQMYQDTGKFSKMFEHVPAPLVATPSVSRIATGIQINPTPIYSKYIFRFSTFIFTILFFYSGQISKQEVHQIGVYNSDCTNMARGYIVFVRKVPWDRTELL